MFLQFISPDDYRLFYVFYLIISGIALIVAYKLYSLYHYTKIIGYVYFMIFFICFAIHLLLYPLLVILEYNVLIHQVRYTLLSIAYLSLILHAYHVYNDKGSRIAKWIGISVFVVLQIIILL